MDSHEQYGFGLLLLTGMVLNTVAMALLTESMILTQGEYLVAFPVLLYLVIIGATSYAGLELVLNLEGTRRLALLLLVVLLVGMIIINPILPLTWVGMTGLNALFVLGLIDLLLTIVIVIHVVSK
jgi:hypothetical protein